MTATLTTTQTRKYFDDSPEDMGWKTREDVIEAGTLASLALVTDTIPFVVVRVISDKTIEVARLYGDNNGETIKEDNGSPFPVVTQCYDGTEEQGTPQKARRVKNGEFKVAGFSNTLFFGTANRRVDYSF